MRDVTFEPLQEQYYMNEWITCKALGNPDPEIVWEPLHDPSLGTVYSNRLQLVSVLLGDNRWRCVANNSVEGNLTSATAEIEFTVRK